MSDADVKTETRQDGWYTVTTTTRTKISVTERKEINSELFDERWGEGMLDNYDALPDDVQTEVDRRLIKQWESGAISELPSEPVTEWGNVYVFKPHDDIHIYMLTNKPLPEAAINKKITYLSVMHELGLNPEETLLLSISTRKIPKLSINTSLPVYSGSILQSSHGELKQELRGVVNYKDNQIIEIQKAADGLELLLGEQVGD